MMESPAAPNRVASNIGFVTSVVFGIHPNPTRGVVRIRASPVEAVATNSPASEKLLAGQVVVSAWAA
jgi:hypothetical protein